jgi:hypothetical protein
LSTRFDFSSTIYVGCRATGYGDNLFIYGNSLSTVIDKHIFSDISNDSTSFYGELKEGGLYDLSLNSWMSQDNAIYVNNTGTTESCGSTANPCQFYFYFYLFIFFFFKQHILIYYLFIFFSFL